MSLDGLQLPIELNTQALPFGSDEWNWDRFEDFCEAVVRAQPDVMSAHRYGQAGEKQHGIDIEARLIDGRRRSYQCRKVKSFGPKQFEKLVKDTTFEADEYVALVTRRVSKDVRDIERDLPNWTVWDDRDLMQELRSLPREVAQRIVNDAFGAALRRATLGPSGPIAFDSPDNFYRDLMDEKRLFRHNWQLVGRDDELAALRSAIDGHNIVIQPGRGGIGKSRLMRDVVGAIDARVLIANETPLTADLVDDLPAVDDLVILLEDAHRRPADVRVLLAQLGRRSTPATVILTTRPWGVVDLRRAMSDIGVDLSDVATLPALGDLSLSAARELALASLGGSASATLVDRLAERAADCPLMIVIAGQLLRAGQLSISELQASDDFRIHVMERFEDELLEGATRTIAPERSKRLLEIVAAAQPISTDDRTFLDAVAAWLDVDMDTASRALDEFEDGGLIVTMGRTRRIVPDVLADHLLSRACYRNAQPTTFVQTFVGKLDSGAIARLMRNTAELDWRLGSSTGLTRPLWDYMLAESETPDDAKRCWVLDTITPVAVTEPRSAIEICDQVTADSDHCPAGGIFGSRRFALGKVPYALQNVGQDPKWTGAAADRLWDLARTDTRDLHSNPSHALRVLAELGSWKYASDTVSEVVDFASSIDVLVPHAWTPTDVVEHTLERDGTEDHSDGSTLYYRPVFINADVTRPIRVGALNLCERLLTSSNAKVARRAAERLTRTLELPRGLYGADVPEEALEQWRAEQTDILERVRRAVESRALHPVAVAALRSRLGWCADHGRWEEERSRAREILDLPFSVEELVAVFICDPWGHMDADGYGQLSIEDVARRVLEERSPPGALDLVASLLEDAAAAGVEQRDPSTLVSVLHTTDETGGVASEILRRRKTPLGGATAWRILHHLRKQHPSAATEAIADFDLDDLDDRRTLAAYFSGGDAWHRDTTDQEIALIKGLVRDDDEQVRLLCAGGVMRYAHWVPSGTQRVSAIELALRTRIDGSSKVAADVCAVLARAEQLPPAEDIALLLEDLVLVPSIEHMTKQLLVRLSNLHPHVAVDVLVRRIKHSASREDPFDMRYDALPRHEEWGLMGELEVEDRRRQLKAILTRFVAPDKAGRRSASRLFWSVAGPVTDRLAVLREWLLGPDDASAELAAYVLADAPWRVLMDRPWFIADLVTSGAKDHRKRQEHAEGSIQAGLSIRSSSRPIGGPDPTFVELRCRANIAAKVFDSHRVRSLFEAVEARVQAGLDRERRDDESEGHPWPESACN